MKLKIALIVALAASVFAGERCYYAASTLGSGKDRNGEIGKFAIITQGSFVAPENKKCTDVNSTSISNSLHQQAKSLSDLPADWFVYNSSFVIFVGKKMGEIDGRYLEMKSNYKDEWNLYIMNSHYYPD